MLNQLLTRRQFTSTVAVTAGALPFVRSVHSAEASLAWKEIVGSGDVPASRWDHTLAADDTGKTMVVFGGRDGGGASLGDLWLFDRRAEAWSAVDAAGPSARFGHAVATDQDARVMYLFGGQSADQFFNDLWALDLATLTWEQLHDGSGQAPTPRYGTSLVKTGKAELITSHGFTFEGRFDDTWTYDLGAGSWTDVSPASTADRPLKRCLHEAVWSTDREQMLLFGGCSSGFGPCPQGDFWAFSPGESNPWKQISLEPSPSARSNPGLVWDAGRNQAILFGGSTEAGYDAGLWMLAADERGDFTWTDATIDPGPQPRSSHDLAITGPRLYLFGGTGPDGPRNDLWLLDLASS